MLSISISSNSDQSVSSLRTIRNDMIEGDLECGRRIMGRYLAGALVIYAVLDLKEDSPADVQELDK